MLPLREAETISMRLRDGVRLDATLWRPAGPGPYPVLLMRQPYGRTIASTVTYAHPAWYAGQGYIVVIQDVRGSGSSEGRFLAYADEAEDGAEAVAWAAALPGSTGQVGMYGFSYQGAAQTLALSQAPPALRAVAPGMAIWDLHAERLAPGGAFPMAGAAYWAAQIGAIQARRAANAAAYAELAAAANGGLRFDEVVPADPAVLRRHAGLQHYALWRGAGPEDEYVRRASSARRMGMARPAVPGFFAGGWFDYHLAGTVAGFRALSEGAAPQHLLIGPWVHLSWTALGAGSDFGPAAQSDIDAMQLGFFDHMLKGSEMPRWMCEGRVRLFDIGSRSWRVFDAWPEGRTGTLHLGGSGRAALRLDDGVLAEDAASSRTTSASCMIPGGPHRPSALTMSRAAGATARHWMHASTSPALPACPRRCRSSWLARRSWCWSWRPTRHLSTSVRPCRCLRRRGGASPSPRLMHASRAARRPRADCACG